MDRESGPLARSVVGFPAILLEVHAPAVVEPDPLGFEQKSLELVSIGRASPADFPASSQNAMPRYIAVIG